MKKEKIKQILCFHCKVDITNSNKCLHDWHHALSFEKYNKEREIWLCGDCDKKVWETRFAECNFANKEAREFKKEYEKKFNSLLDVKKSMELLTSNRSYKLFHKLRLF